MPKSLTERERQVLEAVIETYVQTAEPAGSRTIAKRFGMAVSAATIRNTMSDLEEKGYLYHPHTSAGRIPTDLAYRVYVDSLMRLQDVSASDSHQIREELGGEHSAGDASGVLLSSAQLLAEQPEFQTKQQLQGLMQVTERRDVLREALVRRLGGGLTITIGSEHQDPKLAPFTLVTSSYRAGPLAGVIGVMGPTRMPYDKIVALVDHTSRLVGELLQ